MFNRRPAAGAAGLRPGAGAVLLLAATSFLTTVLLAAQQGQGLPGSPLPELTPKEFEEFRLGLEDFLEVETAEEGLGPAFNGTSCAVCHNVPAVGGIGLIAETRAGRRSPSGDFESSGPDGETLFHLFSVPGHG